MPYTSLEQAAAANPIIDEVREAVGVTSYAALWRLLLQAHPGFTKTKLHMIGERDPVQAQAAAKELCGQAPMTFKHLKDDNAGEVKHHPLLQPILSPGFTYLYTFLQMIWNMFLDAGKSEPQRWVLNRLAITHVGAKYDRVAHPLLKKRVWSCCFEMNHQGNACVYSIEHMQVGTLPVLQFYAFGCSMLGSMVAVTVNGSKCAKPVMKDLKCWVDHLTAPMKEWIMHQRYGNEAAAVDKLRGQPAHKVFADLHFPSNPQELKPADFNPDAFLVSSYCTVPLSINHKLHVCTYCFT